MKCGAKLVRIAAAICCAAIAVPAAAVTLVEGDSARFEWTHSSGPVEAYIVYVSRNGAPKLLATSTPSDENWATVSGVPGEEIEVQVQAVSSLADPSPLSEVSERIRLVEPGGSRPEFPDVPQPVAYPATPMDFDGDGRSDLLFRNPTTGELKIWLLDWTSVTEVTDLGVLAPTQRIAGNADYDGDGYADLLLRDETVDELEIRYLVGGHLAEAARFATASGWKVATSAVFHDEGAASIVLYDSLSGSVERIDASGTLRRLSPLPVGARLATRFVAGIDLDDDGVVEILYQSGAALIAHTPSGPATGSFSTGVVAPFDLAIAGACNLPGSGRDAILASEPGVSQHRLGFEDGALRVGVDPIEGLSSNLSATPATGAGDFDGDGDCDLTIRTANGEVWMILLNGNRAETGWPVPSPGADWLPAGIGAETPRVEP